MNDPFETVAPAPGDLKPLDADAVPPEHPPQIGRYRIEKILGEGGFGRVYLAHDDQLNRAVAIKVPRAERLSGPEDAEAYLTEARTVAGLDHPNIVPIFDFGTTPDGLCYVVSKVIDGSDLAQRIRHTHLSHGEAVGLIAIVAEALHYAHRKGLVHRDIKPANILIDRGAKPYLADFGLALKEEDFGKGTGFAGTPAYMSPEQARGEGHRVDGRSDIFSLGVVLYELLTGRRPFRAESQRELLEQIISVESRPPRQIDDAIPKELDRICLKAISKRASERYSTAQDFADDLRCVLASVSISEKATVSFKPIDEGMAVTAAPSAAPTSAASQGPIKIVPKGLRSFDANDADFFLDLLPGPRDRIGLPDSLRFWKTRIEESDADNTFSIGLIYGPSGCGKSSLMKAGLLPRLADHVNVVYVEATADNTETRLLKGLRKHCPDVPESLGVIEALASLRRGQFLPAGKKVILILDQFEQWLHVRGSDVNSELVRALRHCDGARVQCIVMVRDDFGMAAARFMGAVDITIVQGHNFATVDLFDLLHARKVLAEFGRAFGRLPDNLGKCSKEQEAFLDQAVAGLNHDGKVISVRLALFAEMVKGKLWTPTTLKEVGGTEGVGVTFLEETFTASSAPPQHRLHQKAAQAVLKAMLPDRGSDIKGNMRSQEELLAASDYASRPKDFEELIRILDREIRLITPTAPEGKETSDGSTSQASPGQKYYQLTHDYLVPSLRDWLGRKQKETRRGRAELLLADRASIWNARPEDRQLPSLWQWGSIRWLTAKKDWTPPQRTMMAKAGRYHAMRGALLVLVLVAATVTGIVIRNNVVERENAHHAAHLVQRVLDADIMQVPEIIKEMEPYRAWTEPIVKEQKIKASMDSRQELHASLVLLPIDPSQKEYLYARLLDAQPQEVAVIRDALAPHKQELLDKLWSVVEQPAKGKEGQRLRAASALAAYDPDSRRWAKVSAKVSEGLVSVNPVFLGLWSDNLRSVKATLIEPLSAVFRNHAMDRAAERMLATNLLVDYAKKEPRILAGLLMDADEKQFAVVYPMLEERGELASVFLKDEIIKQLPTGGREVHRLQGEIDANDGTVKVSNGQALPAKHFDVPLRAGQAYHLAMTSKDLDSFLVLHDRAGKELAYDDDSGGKLNASLVYTPAKEDTYRIYAATLSKTGSFLVTVVELADEDAKEKLAKRQANAAVALLKMNQPDPVWPLLRHSPDPRVRSYLIHRLGPLGVAAGPIVKRLDEEPDVTAKRALILSLGEFNDVDWMATERKDLVPKLQQIYRTAPDPGLHAAAEWLLRHWKQDDWLRKVNSEWAADQVQREKRFSEIKRTLRQEKRTAPPQWYVNGKGQTMVVLPGPVEFLMGSPPGEKGRTEIEPLHRKRIDRTFALSAKLVTLEQYRQFDPQHQLTVKNTSEADFPVVWTSWFQAAAYCNWLSKEEGIDPKQWCYEIEGQATKLRENYLSLSGYRLPTESELEFATRAGAVTSRYYGEAEDLLPKYGWYPKNSMQKAWPVGSLKPNDLGLFDAHGNVFSWCLGRPILYPADVGEDTEEDVLEIKIADNRALRGGSFLNQAFFLRSAFRNLNSPSIRSSDLGFRVARTIATE